MLSKLSLAEVVSPNTSNQIGANFPHQLTDPQPEHSSEIRSSRHKTKHPKVIYIKHNQKKYFGFCLRAPWFKHRMEFDVSPLISLLPLESIHMTSIFVRASTSSLCRTEFMCWKSNNMLMTIFWLRACSLCSLKWEYQVYIFWRKKKYLSQSLPGELWKITWDFMWTSVFHWPKITFSLEILL